MTSSGEFDDCWGQLSIYDPNSLSGESVLGFANLCASRASAEWAALADVECSGVEIADREGLICPSAEILKEIGKANQIDWAFLFLFSVRPGFSILAVRDQSDHLAGIRLADVTLRFADGAYVYVYSRNPNLMDFLRSVHPNAGYKVSRFSQLDVLY